MFQPAVGVSGQTVDPFLQNHISRLGKFLVKRFNASVGLVRESSDDSITEGYWLLSDNLIAMHVLAQDYPAIAAKINQTLQRHGIFTDGLHEALFGAVIQFPPYTPTVKTVQKNPFLVKVEVRSNSTGEFQPDWIRYADLLSYGALSAYNARNYPLADYYFNQALQLWNGAGLWDLPTQRDGFYSVYKLGLLMLVADMLNMTIPYRAELEAGIWRFQRRDGGIRAFYLGNMTSNREANSETAGLVLLAYQFEIQKNETIARQQQALEQAQARAQMIQQALIGAVAIFMVVLTVFPVRKEPPLNMESSFLKLRRDGVRAWRAS